jgi:hypothetical protein
MFISSISRRRSGLIGATEMDRVIVRLLVAEGAKRSVLAASRSIEAQQRGLYPYLTTQRPSRAAGSFSGQFGHSRACTRMPAHARRAEVRSEQIFSEADPEAAIHGVCFDFRGST